MVEASVQLYELSGAVLTDVCQCFLVQLPGYPKTPTPTPPILSRDWSWAWLRLCVNVNEENQSTLLLIQTSVRLRLAGQSQTCRSSAADSACPNTARPPSRPVYWLAPKLIETPTPNSAPAKLRFAFSGE